MVTKAIVVALGGLPVEEGAGGIFVYPATGWAYFCTRAVVGDGRANTAPSPAPVFAVKAPVGWKEADYPQGPEQALGEGLARRLESSPLLLGN
ncbi:unnamed protein product [marine sediment metagenome]|uniref:Uncharacterized protein n=1 Tax=marine sediment metagenome TaxID=412755 RepID=X1QYT8_9ZZZZ